MSKAKNLHIYGALCVSVSKEENRSRYIITYVNMYAILRRILQQCEKELLIQTKYGHAVRFRG